MNKPLPDVLRPTSLNEFIGQSHLLGDGELLHTLIEGDKLSSAIFYGNPGSGKTTLAHIISNMTSSNFIKLNATNTGIKDVRNIVKQSQVEWDLHSRRTVVFCDEIHRYPKNIQDAFLPYVEDGTIILIGATTQNPYFSIIPALISRSNVFEFKPLTYKDLVKVIMRGVEYYRSKGAVVTIDKDAIDLLVNKSSGDARKILLTIEYAVDMGGDSVNITRDLVMKIIPHRSVIYDKNGEGTYDILSCIQGSIQASDVHSSIFWLARAINSGEDIAVICRRLLVTAAEDVGCCNPMALVYVNSAVDAAMKVGFPEASIILSSAVAYMAMNPRSKASYRAIHEAIKLDQNHHIDVPKYLKDCHYQGAKNLGNGSYHDGANMSVYKPIIHDLFKPENGEEIDLMKYNDGYWKNNQ